MGRPKLSKKRMICTRLPLKPIEFHRSIAPTRNAGLSLICTVFPDIYSRTLTELKGRFTLAELETIVNLMEDGAAIYYGSHELAGRYLAGKITELDEMMNYAYNDLTAFQALVLELWAAAYRIAAANSKTVRGYCMELL